MDPQQEQRVVLTEEPSFQPTLKVFLTLKLQEVIGKGLSVIEAHCWSSRDCRQ